MSSEVSSSEVKRVRASESAEANGSGDPAVPELALSLERYPRARAIETVRALSHVNPWRSTAIIAFNWGVIFFSAWAAYTVGTWWAYVIAIPIIATRQQALGVLIHDGAHFLLYRNHTLNDLVSDALLAFPLSLSTTLYRRTHFLHHRFTNTQEDPDLVFQDHEPDWWEWPKTRWGCFVLQVKALFGINSRGTVKQFIQWNPWAHMFTPISPAFPLRARVLLVVTTAVFYSVILHYHLIVPALLLYVLPSVTLVNFFNHWRSVAEHIATQNTHELNATRTVIPSLWERLTIAPHGVNYHLEHHLYPSVPGPNLAKLHQKLMEDEEFREKAIITQTYAGLLRELMRDGNPGFVREKAAK